MIRKTWYFSIARVILKFEFEPQEDIAPTRQLISQIFDTYKGFLIRKPIKIDYHLIISKSRNVALIEKDKSLFVTFGRQQKNVFLLSKNTSSGHILLLIARLVTKNLEDEGGFVLHASGCLINNKVHVFLARSTGGKSTLVRLLKDVSQILFDDSIFIRKENDSYRTYQSHFIDKQTFFSKTYKGKYIQALYYIHKSKNLKIARIPDNRSKYIFQMLLAQVASDQNLPQSTFNSVLAFVRKHQFFHLYFDKYSQPKAILNMLMKND